MGKEKRARRQGHGTMDIVKGNGDKIQRDNELKGQRNWVTEESGKGIM